MAPANVFLLLKKLKTANENVARETTKIFCMKNNIVFRANAMNERQIKLKTKRKRVFTGCEREEEELQQRRRKRERERGRAEWGGRWEGVELVLVRYL